MNAHEKQAKQKQGARGLFQQVYAPAGYSALL